MSPPACPFWVKDTPVQQMRASSKRLHIDYYSQTITARPNSDNLDAVRQP